MFILSVCTHIHHSVYMEVRWQLAGACGSQGQNSRNQAWGQSPSLLRSLLPENEFLFPIYPRHWHQCVYTPIIISLLRIRKPFPHFLCLTRIYCLSSHSTAVTKHNDLSNLEKAALVSESQSMIMVAGTLAVGRQAQHWRSSRKVTSDPQSSKQKREQG